MEYKAAGKEENLLRETDKKLSKLLGKKVTHNYLYDPEISETSKYVFTIMESKDEFRQVIINKYKVPEEINEAYFYVDLVLAALEDGDYSHWIFSKTHKISNIEDIDNLGGFIDGLDDLIDDGFNPENFIDEDILKIMMM